MLIIFAIFNFHIFLKRCSKIQLSAILHCQFAFNPLSDRMKNRRKNIKVDQRNGLSTGHAYLLNASKTDAKLGDSNLHDVESS